MSRYVLLTVVVLILTFTIIAAIFIKINKEPGFSLHWLKQGGIAGVAEEFVIYKNSSWSYKLSVGGKVVHEVNGFASYEDLNKLMNSLRESGITQIRKFSCKPKPEAADYFIYNLKLTLDGAYVDAQWIDEWASETKIPDSILKVEKIIEEFIESHKSEHI
ncbi:MAG: hypothetical protein QXZ53_06305 [Candidatus Bathyarchaeia archaeon]